MKPVPEGACPDSPTYVIVEQMPELLGGLNSIQQLVRYPPEAIEGGLEGRVIVQFKVDPDGNVMEGAVVRGVSTELDVEALRVALPGSFEPGRHLGESVCVKMSLPITFRLNKVRLVSQFVDLSPHLTLRRGPSLAEWAELSRSHSIDSDLRGP